MVPPQVPTDPPPPLQPNYSSRGGGGGGTADHHQRRQNESVDRVLFLSSKMTGTLRIQIRCVDVFHGELLNDKKDVDRTGLMLWPASYSMCAFLMASRTRLMALKHAVDLGSGACALAGLLLSHLCPSSPGEEPCLITLTDGDKESLEILQWNARHHYQDARGGGVPAPDEKEEDVCDSFSPMMTTHFSSDPTCEIQVKRLRWGNQDEAQAIIDGSGGQASWVLGSDVLYPSIPLVTIRALLQSARHLLLGIEGKEGNCPPPTTTLHGCLVLSFIDRDHHATLRFLMVALREEWFQLEEVVQANDMYSEATGFVVMEEEEEEVEEEDGGEDEEEDKDAPHQREKAHAAAAAAAATTTPPGRTRFRRRRVQLMTGGMILVLRAVAVGQENHVETCQAREVRWFPNLWQERMVEVAEEWEGPPLSSSSSSSGSDNERC